MPTNLELKIKVNSLKSFEEKLSSLDAAFEAVLNQKDIYYKTDNGLLKLRIENGTTSLIFYKRDEQNKNRFSDFEYVKFSEGDAEKIFKNFLQVEAVVEKTRKLYLYNNTRIHLDEVNSLGNFLELETLVLDGKAEAQERFNEIIKLLEINTAEQIRKSYRDLILEMK